MEEVAEPETQESPLTGLVGTKVYLASWSGSIPDYGVARIQDIHGTVIKTYQKSCLVKIDSAKGTKSDLMALNGRFVPSASSLHLDLPKGEKRVVRPLPVKGVVKSRETKRRQTEEAHRRFSKVLKHAYDVGLSRYQVMDLYKRGSDFVRSVEKTYGISSPTLLRARLFTPDGEVKYFEAKCNLEEYLQIEKDNVLPEGFSYESGRWVKTPLGYQEYGKVSPEKVL